MLRRIHMQNRLLLHLEYETVLVVYRILHVDPMPRRIRTSSKSFSYLNLLEWVRSQ